MTPADAAAIASVAFRASRLVDQLQGELASLRVMLEERVPANPKEAATLDLLAGRVADLTRLAYADNASEITEHGNGSAWIDLELVGLGIARLVKEGDPYYG